MKCRTLFAVLALMVICAVPARAEDPATPGKLNVNTATVEQLSAVPGLNADVAQAIMKYREEMGDIQNIDELTEVPGITPDVLGKIKEHVGTEGIAGSECSC